MWDCGTLKVAQYPWLDRLIRILQDVKLKGRVQVVLATYLETLFFLGVVGNKTALHCLLLKPNTLQ